MSISAVAQSLQPDADVELFIIDLAKVGGPMRYFVQGRETGGPVSFGGQVYEAIDVQFDGLETSAVGSLPTPTISIANSNGVPQTLINTYGDILGCKLYRIRTFARFLDGHESPDAEAMFGPDIFEFTQRTSENVNAITWELSAAIDQAGKMLPGRQVIRDTCLWRYRRHTSGASFDYSKAECPYVGSAYFDVNDQPVTSAAEDTPSRNLSCCKVRFGANNPLPFGGFPGVARVRR